MLTREQFLTATTRRYRDITLPTDFEPANLAGQTIRCWSMTALQQAQLQAGLIDPDTGKPIPERITEIKALKVIATAGDETGNPLFTAEDLPAIQQLPAALVDAVCDVAEQLNKLTLTPDDAKKNSKTTGTENSPTS